MTDLPDSDSRLTPSLLSQSKGLTMFEEFNEYCVADITDEITKVFYNPNLQEEESLATLRKLVAELAWRVENTSI